MVLDLPSSECIKDSPRLPVDSSTDYIQAVVGSYIFSLSTFKLRPIHQIRTARENPWSTAFHSAMGLFEYRVMPFGLQETPANSEERLMSFV